MKRVLFIALSVISLTSCTDKPLENLEKKNKDEVYTVSDVDRDKIVRPGNQGSN